MVKPSRSDHLSYPPTIQATWTEMSHLTMGIYPPRGHICHRKNPIPKTSPGRGCGCGACVGIPRSRHFNISVDARLGGSACVGSRRVSIISRSVGTERGGGACANTDENRRFSIVSRSANLIEGPVKAATTCSVGPSVSSLTAYTGWALSGVGFTTLRSSVSAWLSHNLHLSTMSLIGVSGGTLTVLSNWRR